MKLSFYEIEWLDARSEAGWFSKDDAHPNRPMIMCCYIVSEDADNYITASNYDPQEDGWSEKGIMPKGIIKSMKVVYEREA